MLGYSQQGSVETRELEMEWVEFEPRSERPAEIAKQEAAEGARQRNEKRFEQNQQSLPGKYLDFLGNKRRYDRSAPRFRLASKGYGTNERSRDRFYSDRFAWQKSNY